MNNNTGKNIVFFKISWLVLLFCTVCDYSISDKFSLGLFTVNVQASSLAVMIYFIVFLAIFPLKNIPEILNIKYDKYNIILMLMMLILAYISSYFSLMQKYALVTTTSRYTLYFAAFIITVCYIKYYESAGNFILKSFVFINLLIALSSIAEYFIPGFYRILIDHFGVMESRHANMHIGDKVYMRPSGFITDVNLTALTLGLSSYLLLLNRDKFNKVFEYSFYIITGITFGMLASRSALIMVIFLLCMLIVFKQVNWKNALVYFILFVVIQIITPQTQARFFNISDQKKKMEEMELGRPLIWKADYLAMQIKPLIGIGSGVFFKQSEIFIAKAENRISDEKYLSGINDPFLEMNQGINPHNIFYTMQIEYGIGGTILFILLVIFNLFSLIRIKKFNSLALTLGILFVSSLSNYAPYYKYYLLVIIIYYISINRNLKMTGDVQRS